jgi:hypothetical protein
MIHRTQAALTLVARDYPDCWRQIDHVRHSVRAEGVTWPEWCWTPMAASYAVVSGGGDNRVPLERAHDVGRLAALSTWRLTQGIYRVDETLLDELWASDVDGALPVETLHHLPEWCVYVETPGRTWQGQLLRGFWAHLEHEVDTGSTELRLLIDTDEELLPLPLPLGRGGGTLADAGFALLDSATAQLARSGDSWRATAIQRDASASVAELTAALRPLVSVVLYLCTTAEALRADDGRTPSRPEPRPARRGETPRYYPPAKPAVYVSGVRLGAALRAARERAPSTGGGVGASPTGHVRRAHWHTYVMGPRTGPQRREVRWLPPILVRLSEDDVAPVVRTVN